MKKIISIFLLVAMLISVIPCVALSAAAEGENIKNILDYDDTKVADGDVYEISSAEGLMKFATLLGKDPDKGGSNDSGRAFGGAHGSKTEDADGNTADNGTGTEIANWWVDDITFRLTADIDLNPGWDASSGTKPTNVWPTHEKLYFEGTFDGQGHTISGIYQDNTDAGAGFAGLFGATWGRNVTVKNLAITNSYSSCDTSDRHGFLFGSITNGTNVLIDNVYVDARIVNTGAGNCVDAVGGLIGNIPWNANTHINITNTVFAGSIEVTPTAETTYMVLGGMIGLTNVKDVTIDNCVSCVTLVNNDVSKTPAMVVGGFIGIHWNTDAAATVQNCVSDCTTLTSAGTNAYGSIVGGCRINDKKYSYVNGTGNVATSERAIGCCWDNTNKVADIEGNNYKAVCTGSNERC